MRVFDFRCENGHVHEQFVNDINQPVPCSTCGADTVRLVSTPTVKLPGWDSSFPGAALKWDRVREEKRKQEIKRDTWQTTPR
jgi:hypothetical protein